MERTIARDGARSQPAGPAPGRDARAAGRRQQGSACRYGGTDRHAHRRRAALCRRVDKSCFGVLDELLGDVPGVRAHAEAIVELADRHNLGYWRVNGLILRGWAMVQEGATEAGIALMRQNAADRAAQ